MNEFGTRKKLIETAMPLNSLNRASAREKSINHGHPSTLHPWWSRKPLATCRAVLFAQLVDDPSAWPEEFPTNVLKQPGEDVPFNLLVKISSWKTRKNQRYLTGDGKKIAGPMPEEGGAAMPSTQGEAIFTCRNMVPSSTIHSAVAAQWCWRHNDWACARLVPT